MYAGPFKRPSDNYFALSTNVALLFSLVSCIVLEQGELVDVLEQDNLLKASALRVRFKINSSSVTAVLLASTLFVLAAALLVLLHSLKAVHKLPLLRLRADGTVVEPPAIKHGHWHAFISHTWSTGQDLARVLKERLQCMVPRLRLFLDVDDLRSVAWGSNRAT